MTLENAKIIKADILIQCGLANSNLKNEKKAEEYFTQIANDTYYAQTSWKNYAESLIVLLKQKKNLSTVEYSLTAKDPEDNALQSQFNFNSIQNPVSNQSIIPASKSTPITPAPTVAIPSVTMPKKDAPLKK